MRIKPSSSRSTEGHGNLGALTHNGMEGNFCMVHFGNVLHDSEA